MCAINMGFSFSPDNTKLYVTNQTRIDLSNLDTEVIRQYDLSAGSTEALIASGKSVIYQNPNTNVSSQNIPSRQGFFAFPLQIGPDGRIYEAADYSNPVAGDPCKNCDRHFLVINKPNEPGFACDVQLQAAELGAARVGDISGLPNFMQHYFNGLEPKDCPFDHNDECTDANVNIFPNPVKDELQLVINDLCFTPYKLQIINVAGQVLSACQVTTPVSQKLNVSHLATGAYFVELQFTDRKTTKRFIKH